MMFLLIHYLVEKDKGMELILYNLYVKAVSVILQARIRREDLPLKEKEKEANPPWFNLIEPVNLPKSEFSPWKEDLYHPLYLTFYLDLSKLTDQTVILKNNGSNQKLTLSQDFLSKKKYIILEEWILQWKYYSFFRFFFFFLKKSWFFFSLLTSCFVFFLKKKAITKS